MSDLLALARDYIERMANPVYGFTTNEDYSLRFAQLLDSEEFRGRLQEAIAKLSERDALSSHGWLWLFGWARSTGVSLDERLLVELFDEWSSVFAKSLIVDVATRDAQISQSQEAFTLTEFPNPFLAKIMTLAISPRDEEFLAKRDRFIDERGRDHAPLDEPKSRRAEGTLVALLQAGTPLTLRAASTLLNHRWLGHRDLVAYFWSLTDTLDDETRSVWLETLRPPPRGPGSPRRS